MTFYVPAITKEVAVSSSATSAESLGNVKQVTLRAVTADIIVRFGGSSVAASASKTGNDYSAGTVIVYAGESAIAYTLREDQDYFSAIRKASTDGTLIIECGEGEV